MLTWSSKMPATIQSVFGSTTKTLFRRSGTMEADFLAHHEGMLTFVTNVAPESPQLRVELNTGNCRTVLSEVRIHRQRRTESGEFVCQALWPGELQAAQVPKSSEHLQREPRSGRRLRVLSAELPSFLALTHDISRSGLSLEVKGSLQVGAVLNLQVELDMPGQNPLGVKARVAWCREGRAGLAFVDLEPSTSELLQRYEQWMEGTYLKPARVPAAQPPTEVAEVEKEIFEEPKPPAGHLQNLQADDDSVEVDLLRASGSRYRLTFPQSRLIRDQRGLYGSGFDDALEHHDSELAREVRRAQPINLEESTKTYHYQFLNRAQKVVLEVVCLRPVRATSRKERPAGASRTQ